MSTWIVWSPKDSLEGKFPDDFLQGNHLDKYQNNIETESCSNCGHTIRWVSDKYQYENYNEEIHQLIASLLK